MKYFALLGVLLFVAACGSKDHNGFVDTSPTGGTAGASNLGGAGGRAGSAGSGGTDPSDAGAAGAQEDSLAPVIEITAPDSVSDPNKGNVLTDSQVVVTCTVKASSEAGAAKVLTSSVAIQLLGADGKKIGMDGNVHSTDNSDEYAATFTLTDVPSGPVSFVCSASDESISPKTASAKISTFVDHGPDVVLKNPAQGSAHAVSPALLFKFSVLPVPLSDGDKVATVTAVSLKVDNVEIPDVASHELPGMPGEYQISIDLNDPTLFPQTPTGAVPVRIVAANKRGTQHTSDFSFNVDSTGPVIQIISPATPNSFVGGKVTLAFSVADSPAGVDPATVQVVLNNKAFIFDPKNGWANPTSGNFSFTFDSQQFGAKVQLAVNIRADDLAGNPSDGASILYYLDNVPPIIDMAPGPVQEVRYINPATTICSAVFNPLGDSPKDLETVQSLTRLRALLWDVGNVATGQDAFYFSDIDNSNTNTVPHLYIQPDTSKPLLKNVDPTKHGAVCNAIADETLPLVTLVPLAPTGTAYYPSNAPTHVGICGAGTDGPAPDSLCGGHSDLVRVLQHEVGLASQVVSAVYVIAPDALQCTGTQFQISNIATDGWVCAAVSAVDRTGNRAVSAPLRLCLDSDSDPTHPACAVSSMNPPSCVTDCVAPAPFDASLIYLPH